MFDSLALLHFRKQRKQAAYARRHHRRKVCRQISMTQIAAHPPPLTDDSNPPPTLQSILNVKELRDRVLFHVPPSTLCTGVSRTFQSTLDQEEYWQAWIEAELKLVAPEGVIKKWRNDELGDWSCYWDGSSGMPHDRKSNYVFCPPLEMSSCGVVRPRAWDLTQASSAIDLYKFFSMLLHLKSKTYDCCTIGWDDTGNGQWIPFMLPWNPAVDGVLSPKSLLVKLGAHPQIQGDIQETSVLEEGAKYQEGETGDQDPAAPFCRALQAFLSSFSDNAIFFAGPEKLNPAPCFAVARVSCNLVAGFICGFLHT